ncbi:MAG: cytochrome c-type biogenesis CcmF C-terminal domain-containing protein, partial [Terriglobales bacterium]
STLAEDLYVVYEGQNQDTGRPIIKVHLNPLVMWIWIGVWIVIAGTVVAMIPNEQAQAQAQAEAARVAATARVTQAEPVGARE